jgi:hypothetical protein
MSRIFGSNRPGRKALAARKWFAENGPPDVQPLPLGYDEREQMKSNAAMRIVPMSYRILAWYARSLDCRKYDVLKHPSFEDYACGVMASQFSPPDIQTGELQSRFPARSLYGLGPGLIWEPPEQYEETMASLRRRELLQNRNNVEKNDGVDR